MEQRTHKLTSKRLVGKPVKLEEGYAEVELVTIDEMKVDEKGLVHGGFTFGLADYAAMLAVNEPTVVLGKAEVRFTKPVKVGDKLLAKGYTRHACMDKKGKVVRPPVFLQNIFQNNQQVSN